MIASPRHRRGGEIVWGAADMPDTEQPEKVYMTAERVPFTQVSDAVLLDERTTQAERLLYWVLSYHVNVKRGDRVVWPGQRRLRALTKMGPQSVVDGLKALVQHGYLVKIDPGSNRTAARYHLGVPESALPSGNTPEPAIPEGSAAIPDGTACTTGAYQNKKMKEQESGSDSATPSSGGDRRAATGLRRHSGETADEFGARELRYRQTWFRVGDKMTDGRCSAGHDVHAQLLHDFGDRDYSPLGVIEEECQRCASDSPDLTGMLNAELARRGEEVES